MEYEDWPKHEATVTVKAKNRSRLVAYLLDITRNIDAHVKMNGGGRVVTIEPMEDAFYRAGLDRVAAADIVGIQARGPDSVMVVGALKAALEGKHSFGWLHKVRWANEARTRLAGAPYTTVSFAGWFGLWHEFYP